jgi:hypothetical protein
MQALSPRGWATIDGTADPLHADSSGATEEKQMRSLAFLFAALVLALGVVGAAAPVMAHCSPQHTVQAPTTPPQTPTPPTVGG